MIQGLGVLGDHLNPNRRNEIIVETGECVTKVDSREWYCPACDRMCDPSEITNREYHQHCGCFVGGWVQAFSKRLDDINDLEVALGQKDEHWHMAVKEARRLTAELAPLRAQLDEAVRLLFDVAQCGVCGCCPWCEQSLANSKGEHRGGCKFRAFLMEHPRQGATIPTEKGAEDA